MQVDHPLWNVPLWVLKLSSSSSRPFFKDLEYIVLSLYVTVQKNMCPVTLDQSEIWEGTCPKKVAFLYVLQRRKSLQSAVLATVQHSRHLPLIQAWFCTCLHSYVSFAAMLSRKVSQWVFSFPTPVPSLSQIGKAAAYTTVHIAASPPGYFPFKQCGCIFLSPMVDHHLWQILRGAEVAPLSLQTAWLNLFQPLF